MNPQQTFHLCSAGLRYLSQSPGQLQPSLWNSGSAETNVKSTTALFPDFIWAVKFCSPFKSKTALMKNLNKWLKHLLRTTHENLEKFLVFSKIHLFLLVTYMFRCEKDKAGSSRHALGFNFGEILVACDHHTVHIGDSTTYQAEVLLSYNIKCHETSY